MLEVGVEPTRLAAQDPKSCVSANSTTRAYFLSFQKTNATPRGGLFDRQNQRAGCDEAAAEDGLGR